MAPENPVVAILEILEAPHPTLEAKARPVAEDEFGPELETKLRRVLQILEPPPKLVSDEALGRDKSFDRCLLLVGIAQHADSDARLAQIGRHANGSDAHESNTRILEVTPDDGHDLFPHLLPHLVRAVAGHVDHRLYLNLGSPRNLAVGSDFAGI